MRWASQPNGSNSLADLWGGGHLRAEVMTFDSQACYEVLVNKATYEVAWAHAKNPLTALGIVDQANAFAVLRSYRLGSDDCRHFMGEVAAAIGLRLPDFSTLRSPRRVRRVSVAGKSIILPKNPATTEAVERGWLHQEHQDRHAFGSQLLCDWRKDGY